MHGTRPSAMQRLGGTVDHASTPIAVVAADGFGREVIDVIEAMNTNESHPPWDLMGVVDDSLSVDNRARLRDRSVSYFGTSDDFLRTGGDGVAYAIGIGAPHVRRNIADRFEAARHAGTTLIYPTASMGARVNIGPGRY